MTDMSIAAWSHCKAGVTQSPATQGASQRSMGSVCTAAGDEEPATKSRASLSHRPRKSDQEDGASGADWSEDRPDRNGRERNRAGSTGTTHPNTPAEQLSPSGGGTRRRNTLICGDCDEGMARMQSGSVDVIFTDPPYLADLYTEAYQVLARHAGRLLAPGGYLVTYCPQFHLPVILRILDGSGLAYFWLCAQLNSGAKTIVWSRNAMCGWKPVVIYQKPPVSAPDQIFIDVLRGVRAKAFHPWQQSIHETLHLLSRLAAPGALILDPFAGTGTNLVAAQLLGMNYHGFEIDPATCRIAQDRLTQRPLDLATFSEVTP